MNFYHRQMKMKMELLPDGMSRADRAKRLPKEDQAMETEQLPIGVKIGTFKVEIQLEEI